MKIIFCHRHELATRPFDAINLYCAVLIVVVKIPRLVPWSNSPADISLQMLSSQHLGVHVRSENVLTNLRSSMCNLTVRCDITNFSNVAY